MGNNLTILKLVTPKAAKGNVYPANSAVLITGASSGLGRGLALAYAQRNCDLYSDKLTLVSRDKDQLEQVAADCKAVGCQRVIVVSADVRSLSECSKCVQAAIAAYGQLDILVLCAGLAAYHSFPQTPSLKVYHDLMNTNFFGYLNCTFCAFPYLKASKGQVVVISGIAGEIGLPNQSALSASKFAVTGFFEALRSELSSNQVAITIVCPPATRTNLRKNAVLKTVLGGEVESSLSVQNCVANILAAADRRARKIFFPFRVYFAAYLRPFFPDLIDRRLKRSARL